MLNQDPNNYWEQLERLEKLIKNSELKAGVIFSFHSLILGLFADRLEYFKSLALNNTLLLILISIWLLCVFISIFYCFKCFKPRLEMKYEPNVFFFRDAVSKFGTLENFTDILIKTCENENILYQRLAEQIHVESKIIDAKFKSVQSSIIFFGISFVMVILTIIAIAFT